MFRYENMATEVIKVDLHNDFQVVAMARWNKENSSYSVDLYMQRNDLDTLRLIETSNTIVLIADRKTIKLEMLKEIEKLYNEKFFEVYQEKIDFEDRCFNIGLDTLESR